jgi:aspartyl protease family protein
VTRSSSASLPDRSTRGFKKPLIRALLICLLGAQASWAAGPSLRGQLRKLAQESGFTVEGLERLGPEPAQTVNGDTRERIQKLLQDYNYLLIGGPGGKIERVSITSLKDPNAKPRFNPAVSTTRFGAHHQVQATVTGPGETPVSVNLIVDTGATTLVLPDSMIESLGFRPEQLQNANSQTASDTVPVRVGVLKTVRVGQVTANDVQVSFFPDQRLGDTRLLGMSFLNRFKFSLDDQNNELVLESK